MAVCRLIVAAGLLAQVLVPVAAVAVDATLVGSPSVSPVPLLPGRAADVVVTLRAAGRVTPPMQLEIRVGASVLGRLSDAALDANQTKAYRVTITVPGAASGTLDLRVWAWGTEIGRASAGVQASAGPTTGGAPLESQRPASARSALQPPSVASLTQTVTTAQASVTGNRGQAVATAPSVASLTQTVTTAQASVTGNRGTAAASTAAPRPSLTQTVTTAPASVTGNR